MFKTALVTGATSGIGEALCHLLAKEKIDLIITGRDEAKLDALKEILKPAVRVITFKADLTHADDRNRVIAAIREHAPELIINNAGAGLYGEVFNQTTAEQMDLMELNANAPLQLTLEGVKTLKACGKKGVILNVSSAAAFLTFPLFSIYTSTKAFLNSLSTSLDQELKDYGIRVLAACPGMVRTSFRERASKKEGGSPNPYSMSSEEAARHIWWQINRGKPLYIFNWKYRLMIFVANYLMPKFLLRKILKKSIENLG